MWWSEIQRQLPAAAVPTSRTASVGRESECSVVASITLTQPAREPHSPRQAASCVVAANGSTASRMRYHQFIVRPQSTADAALCRRASRMGRLPRARLQWHRAQQRLSHQPRDVFLVLLCSPAHFSAAGAGHIRLRVRCARTCVDWTSGLWPRTESFAWPSLYRLRRIVADAAPLGLLRGAFSSRRHVNRPR